MRIKNTFMRVRRRFRSVLLALRPKALRARLAYHNAVIRADKLFTLTNNRQYVLADEGGRLVITSREAFLRLSRLG
ncbi:MAG: hypothetical protein HUJ65_04275, partial [Oscillospiraceae bacterium]|nr:hypothetical protein [Oscillospiraceae bacterium]